MANRRILYWVIAIAAVLVALDVIFFENDAFFSDIESSSSGTPSPRMELSSVRLRIDFGDGTIRTFEGNAAPGMTLFSILHAAGETNGLEVITDERGNILSVAGVSAEGPKQWHTYRNNQLITTVPGNVDVAAGDELLFKFE